MSFECRGHALCLCVPNSVYPPSDDSQLLAQAALDACSGDVLEMGCGSGAVSLLLALGGKCAKIVALDLNPEAVSCAKANAKKNKIGGKKINFVVSDLFSSFPPSSRFDFILFNPPYMPTEGKETLSGHINHAFDGGKDGLDTVARFLAQAKNHLAPGGKILLVISSLQPKEKLDKLLARNGFHAEVLAEKRFFFEKLQVLALCLLP